MKTPFSTLRPVQSAGTRVSPAAGRGLPGAADCLGSFRAGRIRRPDDGRMADGGVPRGRPSAPVYQGPPVRRRGIRISRPSRRPTRPRGPVAGADRWLAAGAAAAAGSVQPQPRIAECGRRMPPCGSSRTARPQQNTTVPWWQGQVPDWPQPLPGGGCGYPGTTERAARSRAAGAPAAHPTAMPGWDQGKWSDPTKHDAKYDAGHLMSTLAPSVANIPTCSACCSRTGIRCSTRVAIPPSSTGSRSTWCGAVIARRRRGSGWSRKGLRRHRSREAPGGVDPYTASDFTQLMAQMQSQPQPMPQQAPAAGGVDQTALLQSILQLLQQQASGAARAGGSELFVLLRIA